MKYNKRCALLPHSVDPTRLAPPSQFPLDNIYHRMLYVGVMANDTQEQEVTTREIAAIVPITVAEWYDRESGFWYIEGVNFPLPAMWSSDRNLLQNHVRLEVLASWNHWCEMVNAINAPQHVEEDGYDAG